MKAVWVICQTIDLGYHMVKGYASYDKAKAELERMHAEAVDDKVKALMTHCGYTKEQADDFCASHTFYILESLELSDERTND
jgi:hypothetical protein